MSIEIIHNGKVGCLADNTSDTVFGPLMYADEGEIDDFVADQFARVGDPRLLSLADLASAWSKWIDRTLCEYCGDEATGTFFVAKRAGTEHGAFLDVCDRHRDLNAEKRLADAQYDIAHGVT